MAAAGTVMVIDDQPSLRRSLCVLLEAMGLTSRGFASAQEFLDAGVSGPGMCLLVDIRMPGMSGLELQDELARRGQRIPVVMMSGQADVAAAVRAMKAGAVDLLEKPFTEEALIGAVRRALASRAPDPAPDEWLVADLSPREQQVLRLLAAGQPNKAVGRSLNISPRTVEIHRANILKKLNAQCLADLIRIARSAGLA